MFRIIACCQHAPKHKAMSAGKRYIKLQYIHTAYMYCCRGAVKLKGADTRAALAPRQTTAKQRWLAVLKHLVQGSSSGRQLGGILVRIQ